MSKKFIKADLLAALRPKTVEVEVDGFGSVILKQLTVGESDAMREQLDKEDKSSEFGLRLLGMSMVDESGDRVFSDREMDELRTASGAKIDLLVRRVLEINGYRKEDPEKN